MSKAQTRASNKYQSKAYDRVALLVKKGEREKIKAYAESQGKSLNSYINDLIAADMLAHGYKSPEGVTEVPRDTDVEC